MKRMPVPGPVYISVLIIKKKRTWVTDSAVSEKKRLIIVQPFFSTLSFQDDFSSQLIGLNTGCDRRNDDTELPLQSFGLRLDWDFDGISLEAK